MFSQELEDLIEATLADGVLTDKEKAALVRRAEKEEADIAELEIYIDSLMQKRMQTEHIKKQETALAHDKERRGNVCPHCGTPIPPLTKTCPNCGAAVCSNETAGDKELTKLVDQMESALLNLKSTDSNGFVRAKAEVESLLRKAKTFYGDNKKVQMLVFDLEEEMNLVLVARKKAKNKELGMTIGRRLIYAALWCGLIFLAMCVCFLPFLSEGFRGALGDLWRKMIDGE